MLLPLLLCVLPPAAVRHRVPDGRIRCWFIESDCSVSFLLIQTRFFFMVPLGSTVWRLQPRFAYILGIYGGESPPEYGIISYQICKCQVPPASRPIHLSLRRVGSEWFSKTAAGSNHKALCRKKKEPPKSSSYE